MVGVFSPCIQDKRKRFKSPKAICLWSLQMWVFGCFVFLSASRADRQNLFLVLSFRFKSIFLKAPCASLIRITHPDTLGERGNESGSPPAPDPNLSSPWRYLTHRGRFWSWGGLEGAFVSFDFRNGPRQRNQINPGLRRGGRLNGAEWAITGICDRQTITWPTWVRVAREPDEVQTRPDRQRGFLPPQLACRAIICCRTPFLFMRRRNPLPSRLSGEFKCPPPFARPQFPLLPSLVLLAPSPLLFMTSGNRYPGRSFSS